MIGFLIGTLSLIGLVKLARHSRHGGWHGYGRGWHGYGPGWHGPYAGSYGDPGCAGAATGCAGTYGNPYRGGGQGCGSSRGEDHGGPAPWGQGFGGPGFGGFGPRFAPFFGKRFFMGRLFERLQTTPEQETKLKEVFEEAMTQAKELRKNMKGARKDLANAMRSEVFDETLVGGFQATIEHTVDDMRKQMIGTIAKVHTILDEHQRKVLAEMIEHGPRFSRY